MMEMELKFRMRKPNKIVLAIFKKLFYSEWLELWMQGYEDGFTDGYYK